MLCLCSVSVSSMIRWWSDVSAYPMLLRCNLCHSLVYYRCSTGRSPVFRSFNPYFILVLHRSTTGLLLMPRQGSTGILMELIWWSVDGPLVPTSALRTHRLSSTDTSTIFYWCWADVPSMLACRSTNALPMINLCFGSVLLEFCRCSAGSPLMILRGLEGASPVPRSRTFISRTKTQIRLFRSKYAVRD